MWAGHPDRVPPGTLASRGLEEPAHTSRGLDEFFLQLFCCVSFWFWREIGFGCSIPSNNASVIGRNHFSWNGFAHASSIAVTKISKNVCWVTSAENLCLALMMRILAHVLAIALANLKLTENAHTAAINFLVELLAVCTKFRVKLRIATASTSVNHNDT